MYWGAIAHLFSVGPCAKSRTAPPATQPRVLCSYLVEPIRYRKVVVEMMGPGAGNSGSNDAKPHINLNRDQELAISAAVETFEKRCDEVWKMRETLCEQVKQTRVSRGSELENMRSFIQVRSAIVVHA